MKCTIPKPSIISEMTKKGKRDGNSTSHQMARPRTAAFQDESGNVSISPNNKVKPINRSRTLHFFRIMRIRPPQYLPQLID
ncbi:hypothetical protein D3C81_1326890 [compost metagenome]